MTDQQLLIDNKTELELLRIVASYNKKRNITEMIEKSATSMNVVLDEKSIGRLMARISNLTGPRTVEGRLKSLSNLRNGRLPKQRKVRLNLDDPNTAFLMDDNEKALYKQKKSEYESDFDFNNSSDKSIVSQILMVEIELFRLRNKQLEYYVGYEKNKKLVDPSEKINRKMSELQSLIKTLGADRKLRKGGRENRGSDVATISADFEKRKSLERRKRSEEQAEEHLRTQEAEDLRQKELEDLGIVGKGFKAKEWTARIK